MAPFRGWHTGAGPPTAGAEVAGAEVGGTTAGAGVAGVGVGVATNCSTPFVKFLVLLVDGSSQKIILPSSLRPA